MSKKQNDAVLEIHGIADARKATAIPSDDVTTVTVTDGAVNEIILSVGSQAYAAILTADQAEFLANALAEAVDRARQSR